MANVGSSIPQKPEDLFGELASLAGGGSLLGAPSQPTNLLDSQSSSQSSAGFSFSAAPASSGVPSMSASSF